MSIVAYTGLPGSGKSYSVVELQILPALKAGRKVVTNIPLVMAELDKLNLPGEVVEFETAVIEAEPHKIMEYCEPGCIFIIDECWKLFPQGKQASEIPDVYKKLLAEHRHMVDAQGRSTQIILVVQDLANIGAFARRLVEETFITTKLSFVGLSKSYRVDVFHAAQIGANPPIKRRLRMITGSYKKDIFKLYKSHTMSESGSLGADESKLDTRANIFKRPAFIIGAICCPVLFWYGIHVFNNQFHGVAMRKTDAAPGSPVAAPLRSVAEERHGSGAVPARPIAAEVTARLLFAVEGSGTDATRAYIADGDRVVELVGQQLCRRQGIQWQCLYRSAYYDSAGLVEEGPRAPVAAYDSSRVSGPVASSVGFAVGGGR